MFVVGGVVAARCRIRNIDFLERLVRLLADSVGSVVTAKRISDYLKSQRVRISPNAVLEYLAHQCHACFLAKVHRADVVGRRTFEIRTTTPRWSFRWIP